MSHAAALRCLHYPAHHLAAPARHNRLTGTGQVNYGLNWGNGFITDQNIIKWWKLSDASPFFEKLIDKPYVGKVQAP